MKEIEILDIDEEEKNPKNKQELGKKIFKTIMKCFGLLSATVIVILLTLLITIKMICSDISVSAKNLFVTTILETGQLKFLASIFLSPEEIQKIVDSNSMGEFDEEEDLDLIDIDETNKDSIELVKITGNTFSGKMLIIKDPSRVKVATTYPWSEYGVELDKLVTKSNAIAGVNGGLYQSTGNKGGYPLGVVVCEGEIQYNRPYEAGLYLIGFDENHILRIINLEGMSSKDVEKLVKDEKIRDAVTFQEESSDKNNHFVKLVINGQAREINGSGSGANPRTAIGQRKDGSVLLLVTDGRGASGHLGATAADLTKVMVEYGAVNAANLDGGSSSSMYYNGKYEMTSVTLYYSNSSWRLPTSFVVEKR
jgi:exopolysaccharide biosynthesis protein